MKWTEQKQRETLETGVCRNLHRVRLAYILAQIGAVRGRVGRPLRMLDVGCGDGVIARRLRERFPDDRIEALDADPVRLDRARAACRGIEFRRGDACAMPYSDGTFDVVLCHHVVEHIDDDRGVLRECHRVLATGGRLILGIPHEGGVIGRMLRTLHRRLYAAGEHVHFYTIQGMRRMLVEYGFADPTCAKFGFLFPQYHVHLLLMWCPPTFAIGHWVSQHLDGTADSLIFVAARTEHVSHG